MLLALLTFQAAMAGLIPTNVADCVVEMPFEKPKKAICVIAQRKDEPQNEYVVIYDNYGQPEAIIKADKATKKSIIYWKRGMRET